MGSIKKAYKNTEVGFIPDDWVEKSLKDICWVNQGLQIPISQRLALPNKNSKIYITIQYLNDGKDIEYIDDYSPSVCCNENDILMTRTGNTGIVVYGVEGVFHNNFFKINFDKDKIDKKYLIYYLNLSEIQKIILAKAGTSTIPDLNHNDFYSIPITLPPTKAEQTAIANALSDADALITSLETLIVKKRNIKQGAMQKLLQHKEGWEVKRLGEVGECIIGLTYTPENVKESGTLVLRSSNIQGSTLKYDDNVYVNSHISEKLINQENDILICVRNGSRNLIGKCSLITGVAIGHTFGAFMAMYRSHYNQFVIHLFQSDIIKKQIDEHLGATINQITNKSLNSFAIPFPSLEEQTRIASILSDMDNEITALENKLEKYKKIKLGMMQNLLTGRIRLI